jgi:hypothetical protein
VRVTAESKGNPLVLDNDRGIAVSSAISKIYYTAIMRRLDRWAEDLNLRAVGQACCRHGRGSSDNAFVLQHMIDKYHCSSRPLYAAFIDFRKAYDCIDRQELWESLRCYGNMHHVSYATPCSMVGTVCMHVSHHDRHS